MPDKFFKKLPKFGKINFGTAKVHKCANLSHHFPELLNQSKTEHTFF